MQESPGLKPDWFVVLSLLSRKNLTILLEISLSKILQQTGSKDTERFFVTFFMNRISVGLFPIRWKQARDNA